jgi:hypothetical protein
MRAELEREQEQRRRRFVTSARHTMEIDFDRYLHELAREREAGGRRARTQIVQRQSAGSQR